jgi:hypothetical protein
MAAVLAHPQRMTEAQAADYLSIAAGTLRNWRWQGPGVGPRYVRVGQKLVRYEKADLDKFMAAGAVGGDTQNTSPA